MPTLCCFRQMFTFQSDAKIRDLFVIIDADLRERVVQAILRTIPHFVTNSCRLTQALGGKCCFKEQQMYSFHKYSSGMTKGLDRCRDRCHHPTIFVALIHPNSPQSYFQLLKPAWRLLASNRKDLCQLNTLSCKIPFILN